MKNIRKIIFLISIIFLLGNLLSAQAQMFQRIKNLANETYSDKLRIKSTISDLYQGAANNPYLLSLPLLASALAGDSALYNQVLPKIYSALQDNDMPLSSSKKAWLLGRILLAADTIDDQNTIRDVRLELATSLEDITTNDEFFAWAVGYLAGSSHDLYKKYKDTTQKAADTLMNKYQQDASHDNLSNAIWAWVMYLQAAANAQDKETYEAILEKMKKMTGQSSISNALATALSRTSTANDYPAWAMGIARLAAATIGDPTSYNELELPLTSSIQTATAAGDSAVAEALLANLNNILAMVRWQHNFKKLSEKFKLNKNISYSSTHKNLDASFVHNVNNSFAGGK